MREVYETPEMEVVYFEAEDVITGSPAYEDGDFSRELSGWDD